MEDNTCINIEFWANYRIDIYHFSSKMGGLKCFNWSSIFDKSRSNDINFRGCTLGTSSVIVSSIVFHFFSDQGSFSDKLPTWWSDKLARLAPSSVCEFCVFADQNTKWAKMFSKESLSSMQTYFFKIAICLKTSCVHWNIKICNLKKCGCIKLISTHSANYQLFSEHASSIS